LNKGLWFSLIVIASLVLAGCGGGGGGEFEEASQIYELETDCPTEIGDLVKITEAELTDELADMGAVAGKLLEYASDTDYVLVMAYRFASPDSASQAFQQLEGGSEIASGFYEIESGYYRWLVSDVIYLASGSRDSVVAVVAGIAPAISETAAGKSPPTSF
jgi:hypothetical protein